MQFVFGLGNPGEKYEHTRHNVGFFAVEALANLSVGRPALFQEQARLFVQMYKDAEVLFAKPQTFMNDSGKAVRAVIEYYDKSLHITADAELPHIWVIHDDLDLEVGKYKIQLGTGPKIHNGLASIDEHLHTNKYWHVRIGVDGRQGDRTLPAHEYVLGKFSTEEKKLIDQVISDISRDLLQRLGVVGRPAMTKLENLFADYAIQDKGGYITQEFQDFAYRLAIDLDDLPHKSLYMRLAKQVPRSILEKALSFVSDAANAKSKARLFMWKVKELRKEKGEG